MQPKSRSSPRNSSNVTPFFLMSAISGRANGRFDTSEFTQRLLTQTIGFRDRHGNCFSPQPGKSLLVTEVALNRQPVAAVRDAVVQDQEYRIRVGDPSQTIPAVESDEHGFSITRHLR